MLVEITQNVCFFAHICGLTKGVSIVLAWATAATFLPDRSIMAPKACRQGKPETMINYELLATFHCLIFILKLH